MLFALLEHSILRFFLDVLYFPAWWYGRGLILIFKRTVHAIFNEFADLNLWLWIKNIFVPMYGQYDWQGRLISFFMRVAQIIGRFIFFIIWSAFMIILFLLYLFLPVAVAYGFYSIKIG